MAQAKRNDQVKVHYTGKLADGTVFDSSDGKEPLEFTIGSGQVLPGFEEAVEGMSPGESRTATVPAEKAYGDRRDDMMVEVERSRLPDNVQPEVGQRLQITQPDGKTFPVRVTEVAESKVTLDANHPLAGQEVTFDIELIEIAQ